MHVRRPWSAALVAVTALLLGSMSTAAPAAAAGGITYLQIDGPAGEPVTTGYDYLFVAPTATFTWSTLTPSTLLGSASVLPGTLEFALSAPAGQEFVVGTTYSDVALPGHTRADQAALRIGTTCSAIQGSITVHEVEKDAGTGALTRFAASFVQFCDGAAVALHGSIGFDATKVAPLIVSTTKATAAGNGPVTVSGRLVDVDGRVGGAGIALSRPNGLGGTKTLTATTDANGVFSVADTIGAKSQTYTVSFSGDASRFAVRRTLTVATIQLASTLSVSVPTTTVARGAGYAVKGLLKGTDAVVPGVTVTLKRTDPAGTRTVYVKTTSSGAFIYRDVPQVGGKVTWSASWPGNARYLKAVSAARSLTVSRLVPRLSITTDKTVYPYAGTATVTVRLGSTWNGRTVSLYSMPPFPYYKPKLLTTTKVPSSGSLVVRVPIRSKLAFTVKYAGDYRYLPATAKRTVNVRAKVVLTMTGAHGRSGSTYLFRIGESPFGQGAIQPEGQGVCSTAVVQRLRGSTWETVSRNCAWSDDRGVAGFQVFADTTWRRGRVMLIVPTTVAWVGTSTQWVYFNFT